MNTYINIVWSNMFNRDNITSDHTPNPLYAKNIAKMAEVAEAANEMIDWTLNLNCTVNRVLCTDINAPNTKFSPTTRVNETSFSSLKKREINGAQKKRIRYAPTEMARLKKKTVE